MAMCVHSQEYETCSFGCTFRTVAELRLENDQLKSRTVCCPYCCHDFKVNWAEERDKLEPGGEEEP